MFSKKLTSIVAILSLGFFTFQSCANDSNDSDDANSSKENSLVTETMHQSVMNKIAGNWIEPERAEPWIVEIKNDGSWNNSTLNDLDKITILSEKEAMSVLSKEDIETFGLTTFDDGTNLDKKGFFKMKNERYRQYRIIDENNISLKYQNGSMLYLTRNNSSNQNNSGSVT